MTTGFTQVNDIQIRIRSSDGEEYALHDYITDAERGGRTLADMLGDFFDSEGNAIRYTLTGVKVTDALADGTVPSGTRLSKSILPADIAYTDSVNDHVTVSWDDVEQKPNFATVATSGNYDDLTNKPDLSGYITGVTWNDIDGKPAFHAVATSGSYDDLDDTPDLSGIGYATWDNVSGKPTDLVRIHAPIHTRVYVYARVTKGSNPPALPPTRNVIADGGGLLDGNYGDSNWSRSFPPNIDTDTYDYYETFYQLVMGSSSVGGTLHLPAIGASISPVAAYKIFATGGGSDQTGTEIITAINASGTTGIISAEHLDLSGVSGGGGAAQTGTQIVTAINADATTGEISADHLDLSAQATVTQLRDALFVGDGNIVASDDITLTIMGQESTVNTIPTGEITLTLPTTTNDGTTIVYTDGVVARVFVRNSMTPLKNLVSSVTVLQGGAVIKTFNSVNFQGNLIELDIPLVASGAVTLRFRTSYSFQLLTTERIDLTLGVIQSKIHAQGTLFDNIESYIERKINDTHLGADVNELKAAVTSLRTDLNLAQHITNYFATTTRTVSNAVNFVVGLNSVNEVETHTVVADDLDSVGKLVIKVPSAIAARHSFAVNKGTNREQNIDVFGSDENYFFYEFIASVGDVITVTQTEERESLNILDRVDTLETLVSANSKRLGKDGIQPFLNAILSERVNRGTRPAPFNIDHSNTAEPLAKLWSDYTTAQERTDALTASHGAVFSMPIPAVQRQVSMLNEDLIRFNSTDNKLQRLHKVPAVPAVVGTQTVYPSSATNENLYADVAIKLWNDINGNGHYDPDQGEHGADTALSLTRDLPAANEPITVHVYWVDEGRTQSSHVFNVAFGGSGQVELTFTNGQQAGVRVVGQYINSNTQIEIETVIHGANFAAVGGIVHVRVSYSRQTVVSQAVAAHDEYIDMNEYDVTKPYAIGVETEDVDVSSVLIVTPAGRYETGINKVLDNTQISSLQSSNTDPLNHFYLGDAQ